MNETAFLHALRDHRTLDCGGISNEHWRVVRHTSDGDFHFLVPRADVATAGWDQLESVLLGQTDGQIMIHYSRPVGYFSQIRNWNKSLQGQLRERRKGNYAVPESV